MGLGGTHGKAATKQQQGWADRGFRHFLKLITMLAPPYDSFTPFSVLLFFLSLSSSVFPHRSVIYCSQTLLLHIPQQLKTRLFYQFALLLTRWQADSHLSPCQMLLRECWNFNPLKTAGPNTHSVYRNLNWPSEPCICWTLPEQSSVLSHLGTSTLLIRSACIITRAAVTDGINVPHPLPITASFLKWKKAENMLQDSQEWVAMEIGACVSVGRKGHFGWDGD